MSPVASFAVGSLFEYSDSRPILWGLWDALDHAGYRVQSYHARAAYDPCPAATAITGLCPQHLDSWLMDAATLEKIYQRSAAQSDVAVIHGPLHGVSSGSNFNPQRKQGTVDFELQSPSCSRIESIAAALQLPLLAQVDVRQLQSCMLPPRPENCAGLLLDHVTDRRTWATWKTILESEWQLPVLGAMTACPELRAAAHRNSCSRDVYRHLGNEFRRFTALGELVTTLRTRTSVPAKRRTNRQSAAGLRIAFAYDEVFCCGFRGVLDEFEAQGAELLDFSPLHDEALPHDVDLVYLGCAPVERYAEQLMANTCMVAALREHVCGGRRIYGEVGGAAYLCRDLVLPDGTVCPMLGILPASAVLNDAAFSPEPREVALRAGSWLGSEGETLRGYHSRRWQLVPSEHALTLGQDAELIVRHQAIGSTLQLFPAASEELLEKFLTPCPAALSWAVASS
jgi:cobyrinic acid a,c-diamide synthase